MNLLAAARRHGIERGLFGRSRFWLLVGVIAWLIKGLRWAWAPAPVRVFSGRLEAGESIQITQLPPRGSRRSRRKDARRRKRAGAMSGKGPTPANMEP